MMGKVTQPMINEIILAAKRLPNDNINPTYSRKIQCNEAVGPAHAPLSIFIKAEKRWLKPGTV